MSDLFANAAGRKEKTSKKSTYTAQDIQVLEGLEPVRLRPGMYIGGTDIKALHHLVAEILDNSMDEVVAGHATDITLYLREDGAIQISDNGRGIPIDPHPKFPEKSALEVILTTLHSGGKFKEGVYETSGGLHGVGLSVVNALADRLDVSVFRSGKVYTQNYVRGIPTAALKVTPNSNGPTSGTEITFHPDPEIFGNKLEFNPRMIFRLVQSKAFLHKGVRITWRADASLLEKDAYREIPSTQIFYFPRGLEDYLTQVSPLDNRLFSRVFVGEAPLPDDRGKVQWALVWQDESTVQTITELDEDALKLETFCNTIPTPLGGVHEQGFRQGLLRAFRAFAERKGVKRLMEATSDDLFANVRGIVSLFVRNPHFQGQTKEKLVNSDLPRPIESLIKDHFDHWLLDFREEAETLLRSVEEAFDARIAIKNQREMNRKSPTRRLRLPGKLADCARNNREGTELFLVEGDSAGGSAKQARQREIQAILPLRGKILNVANAALQKTEANRELSDLAQALGCGLGQQYKAENLRYDRVIIMTDADVDGAHIAALLMTFFFEKLPQLIKEGRLYLAQPPLFRVSIGAESFYARDDNEKESLIKKHAKGTKKVEISRFKGLGEMAASQLKETTMDPAKRTLLRVRMEDTPPEELRQFVNDLMGRDAEKRFNFIRDNAAGIVESLDV